MFRDHKCNHTFLLEETNLMSLVPEWLCFIFIVAMSMTLLCFKEVIFLNYGPVCIIDSFPVKQVTNNKWHYDMPAKDEKDLMI